MAPPLVHEEVGLFRTTLLLASEHKARIRVTFTAKLTTFTTYSKILNNVLQRYATDHSIADTED